MTETTTTEWIMDWEVNMDQNGNVQEMFLAACWIYVSNY